MPYTCAYMRVIMDIYEELFQNACSVLPSIEFAMLMPSSLCMALKRALPIYVHIYAHMCIYEKLFSKTLTISFELELQAHFWNDAYCVLEDSS